MSLFKLRPIALSIAALFYSMGTIHVAIADDTEIYVPKDLPADQQVRPNILFVLDTSGSMTSQVTRYPRRNRNQVLHEVVHGLIDELKDKKVNVGFMRYHGNHGGAVTQAVQHLTPSNAQIMKDLITNKIPASGNTPLLETYYEAYRYVAGLKPDWGVYNSTNRAGTDLAALQGSQSLKTYGRWVYKSPIEHSCQKTHIVYITDGAPTQDISSNSSVRKLVGNARDPQGNLTNTKYPASSCGSGQGQCLPHLAEYMANQDIGAEAGFPKRFDDPTNRKQTVTSHFIGFALDLPLLKNAAMAGGGHYFTSDNASELTEALQSIVVDITAENSTFVAPSVAVSAYNSLGFRNELYYALFRPSEGTNWPGNVKKYKLKTKDNDGVAITPIIVDRGDQPAIDDESGFFKDSASSFWNSVVDGSDVAKGGVAEKLKGKKRNIYTWFDGGLEKFSENKVSNEMLGTDSSSRASVIKWITENTGRIGDVLHNEPRLVAYKTDEDLARAETANSKEELVMFFGSNEGYIYAINPKNGEELYSIIPKELLHIPAKYKENFKGYANKAYGMDGLMTTWVEYGDATNSSRAAKKVNLYAGMRRGGSNYYAFDVASKNSPKLKWAIKGAYNPESEITPGFEKLGLTFSAPKLAEINVSGKRTKVLIFTGGYDKKHDEIEANYPKDDEVGNSLYIVDAESGKLLWRVSDGRDEDADLEIYDMKNSMPATPTLVDINGDGLTDIIYASDLRGQIFRFDINNEVKEGLGKAVTGMVLAKVGGFTKKDNRRFFNSPDVALIRDRGEKPYLTVSLGSGFRESPLNQDTDDRFYMIRDKFVYGPRPVNTPIITEAALTDVSATKDGVKYETIYANIDALEAAIKQLNANLANAQDEYEEYKKSIGYTDAYNNYLELYNKYNELQKNIDLLTSKPYETYNPSGSDNEKPYNSLYLTEHALEAEAQSKTQALIFESQQALQALNNSNSAEAQQLANLYAAMLHAQSTAEAQARKLIAQENFLLEGNLNPAWTPELIAKTEQMYPGAVFDSNSGDFSDYAANFSAYIDQERASYKNSSAYQIRASLNTQANTINNTLSALAGDGADVPGLLADLTSQLRGVGVVPTTGNINELLELDQESKLQALNDAVFNYKTNSELVIQEVAEQAIVQVEMQEALQAADALAANGGFEAHQAAIEAAYAAASHPETGISGIRVKINDEYAKLDLADGTLSTAQEESLRTSDGYYLRLPRGEKVLSDSVSYRGTVLFSTFSPRGKTISTCGSDVGSGKTYALSLRDSKGALTEIINGVEYPVRSIEVKRSGIPPAPAVIMTEKGAVVIVGTEIIELDGGSSITPTYWREN